MSDINPPPTQASESADPPRRFIDGERHVSEVAGNAPIISRRSGIGVIIAGAAIVCGVILLSAQKPDLKPNPGPALTARPVVKYEPPPIPVAPTIPPIPQAAVPPLPPMAIESEPPVPKPRLLIYTTAVEPAAGNRSTVSPTAGQARPGSLDRPSAEEGLDVSARPFANVAGADATLPSDGMRSRLTPTRLTGVSASVLANQPYLLTMGTVAPCILQTAMDSTLPGFVTCVVPQDVQGKTGLTLLDRGTRVVGEFRGGVRQGVERLFVVWTRAETPQGVVIDLDSPATDPLGRSGLAGEVDRHFWQRFGSALLLTTVDGIIQTGIAASAKEGSTTINTGQTQGIIAETLRGTINIPPTVRKNQGELVSIFVARDLDFSTVYGVHRKDTP